jgi:hypothetical protein
MLCVNPRFQWLSIPYLVGSLRVPCSHHFPNFLLALAYIGTPPLAHSMATCTQLHSYRLLSRSFAAELGAQGFNAQRLTAAIAFGYASTALYTLFGCLLLLWVEHPGVFRVVTQPHGQQQHSTLSGPGGRRPQHLEHHVTMQHLRAPQGSE